MTSPAQHAATVRECIAMHPGWKQAEAALDAIAAEAEAERDRLAARVTELEAALRHIEQTAAGEADGALRDFARAALDKDKT